VTGRAGGRQRVILYSFALLLLFGAAVVFEATGSQSSKPLSRGIPCLVPGRSDLLRLDGRALPDFFADGDTSALLKRPIIWYDTRTGAGAVAHRLQIGVPHGYAAFPVRLPSAASMTTYDVAIWSQRGAALFALRQRGKAIAVTVLSIGHESRVLFRGLARDPRPRSDVDRDLLVARLTGRKPDLFVIDRHRKRRDATLSVYSGESGFSRTLIDNRTLPVRRIAPPAWSLDVARTDDAKLALVVFRRAAGSLFGRPQVHVVRADSDFRAVALSTTLPSTLARSRQFLVASSRAGPAVYSFTRRRSGLVGVQATPFGVPLSSSSC
jgi:hypothetical protein